MKLNVLSVAKRLRRSGAIITVAVAGMLLLTQCFVKRPSMTSGVVDKVALMGTIVNFQQPLGINAPIAISRSQFKNMSAEINELMSSYVDTLHHAVVANLASQLGCEVFYGKELQSLPQYDKVRETYERADALTSDDENFPEVFVSSGDFNFIITESNPSDASGFNGMKTLNKEEAGETVRNLCSDLGVKYLAYAHFILSGYKMNLLTSNSAQLIYGLSLYNEAGELVASDADMQFQDIKEGQPEVFQFLLDQFIGKAEIVELKAARK